MELASGFKGANHVHPARFDTELLPVICTLLGGCHVLGICQQTSVSRAGRHEFRRGECKCGSCGRMQKTSVLEFIALGAWPCTSDLSRAATFVDERVLSHYAALKDAAPSLSTRAFLEGLAKTSLVYGGTVGHQGLSRISALLWGHRLLPLP